MNGAQPLDVVKIATRVWQALNPEDRPQRAAGNAGDDGAREVRDAPDDEITIETLAHIVEALAARTEHNHLSCERLQQQVQALEEQIRTLPGCIVRLERWRVELELYLKRLGNAVESEPAPAAPSPAADISPDGETGTEPEKWLSVKEVASQYSVSESTVRRYIRQGRLPAVRLPGGRGLRLRGQDVQDCMRPT